MVHKRFGFITEFLSMGADEIEKAAQNLQQCYPNDLELSFPQEFKHCSCFIERLNSDKEMPTCTFTCTAINLYSIIFNHCLLSTFPNVEIAYQMYLSLMATNASGERSFSKLKLIKNEKRTCMHQDRLNWLSPWQLSLRCYSRLNLKTLLKENLWLQSVEKL